MIQNFDKVSELSMLQYGDCFSVVLCNERNFLTAQGKNLLGSPTGK